MTFEDLAIQFVVVALGALAGSTFMWMVLGPYVAKRGMASFTQEAWDLSEEDVRDPKRMMQAITKRQAESFGQAIYGSLGKITEGMGDASLQDLAGKFGVKVPEGLGSGNPGPLGLLGQLGTLSNAFGGNGKGLGDGKPKSMMRIVEMVSALNAMMAMGSNQLGSGSGEWRPGIR